MQYAEMAFTFKMQNRATKCKDGTSTINYARGSSVQKKREAPKPSLCMDKLISARHKQRLRRYLCFISFILLDSLSSNFISFSSFKIHHAPKIAIGISVNIKIVKSIIFVYLSLSFVAFIISLFYWFVKCFLRKYTKKPNFFTSPAFPPTLEVTKMSNQASGIRFD